MQYCPSDDSSVVRIDFFLNYVYFKLTSFKLEQHISRYFMNFPESNHNTYQYGILFVIILLFMLTTTGLIIIFFE